MSSDPLLVTDLSGYRVERQLGRGGMADVYLAEHVRLQRKVALKVLAPDLSEDERFRERFLRESQLAASLDHPNVIPIYDAGEADGRLYIAMRYVEGTDLRELIRREGALDPARAIGMMGQVAEALDAAHERGLVHRDVKPANMLVAARDHVYLSDFGLTKQASSQTGLTAPGQMVGTLDYVAPEQIEGRPVDGRSDLYSLGCVLYECVTGEVPYKRDTEVAVLWAHVQDPPPSARDRRDDLPSGLDDVIAKALAKEPADRYQTGRELVEAARLELGISTGELPQVALARRARKGRLLRFGKSRKGLALLGALLAAGAALVAALTLAGGDPDAPTVARLGQNSIGLIDPATDRLIDQVRIGGNARAIASGAGAVWVATDKKTVSRIDSKTLAVQTTGIGFEPTSMAVGLGAVWLADRAGLRRLDLGLNTLNLVRELDPTGTVGDPSVAVAAGSVWVAQRDRLQRIDPETSAIVATIGLDDYAGAIAVGDEAVWVLGLSETLTRIDIQTNSVFGTTQFPSPTEGDFVTTQHALAVGQSAVWGLESSNVRRFDPDSLGIVAQTAVEARQSSALAHGEGAVWVAHALPGGLAKIDPTTNDVQATILLGTPVGGVVVADGRVWVTSQRRSG